MLRAVAEPGRGIDRAGRLGKGLLRSLHRHRRPGLLVMAIQAPAWLIGAVVASLVAASAPVRAEECRYDFATKSFVGDCGGASGIIPPNGNSQNCNQQEAQVAVDWVFTDVGATRTFQRFLADGNSPLDSVIGAQGH